MPSMPNYFIGKGAQFELIDEQFGGDDRQAAYDAALERLEGESIVELARRHTGSKRGPRLTPGDVEHFEEDWIGFWKDYPVEQVIREGYRKAITLARDVDKPIESYWVCANEKSFQVYVCEGPRQITVLVFTPPPLEHVHEDTLTEDEPIWVVKAHDEFDHGDVESTRSTAGKRDIIVKRLTRAPQQEAHHPRTKAR
jgi:hypothetical protein